MTDRLLTDADSDVTLLDVAVLQTIMEEHDQQTIDKFPALTTNRKFLHGVRLTEREERTWNSFDHCPDGYPLKIRTSKQAV
jgi:hypothetical protein